MKTTFFVAIRRYTSYSARNGSIQPTGALFNLSNTINDVSRQLVSVKKTLRPLGVLAALNC